MQVLKSIKFYFLFFSFAVCLFQAYSQEENEPYTKGFLDSINIDDFFKVSKVKSYFKIQSSYLTNSVYGGRKDSAKLPYFTPTLEYNHKSGAYASVSVGFLPKKSFKQDYISLDIGYSFDTSHHIGGSLYANKIFYSDSSQNVQSNIKLSTGGSFTYYTNLVNFNASGSIIFGDKTDYSAIFSIDHTFNVSNDTSNFSLTVTPTISTYLGSTGFYQIRTTKKPFRNLPPGTSEVLTSPTKFQILSYEISLPISYDMERWGIFFSPTYAVAVNPIVTSSKIILPNGGVLSNKEVATEKISNSFFAEFGFYYKF